MEINKPRIFNKHGGNILNPTISLHIGHIHCEVYSHCLRIDLTGGSCTIVNKGNKLFSKYNNNQCVTHFRIGTRINFEQGWIGIVDHTIREHGRVKTKG